MNKYISKEILEGLDGIVAELMELFDVPGFSVAVCKENDIILKRSYGYRNVETKEPITNKTLIGIGSATKTFTALAIMTLAAEGSIKLDDPISKYTDFKLGDKTKEITIHHLLSHSSGVPALLGSYIAITMALGTQFTNIQINKWDEWKEHLRNAEQEFCFPPGKKWIYFNDGYAILQKIIEKVSKLRYDEFIQQNILNPLEMEKSTFNKENFLANSDIMTGYLDKVPKSHPFAELIYGAGGLISNTMEVLNFMQIFMNEGKFKEQQIFPPDLIKKMTEIHIKTKIIESMTDEPVIEGYGYGFFIVENFCDSKLIFHSGNTSVSTSNMLCIPNKKLAISTVSNSGTGEPLTFLIPFILSAMLIGQNLEEVIFPDKIEMKYASLIGEYESYRAMLKGKIVRKEGMLYFQPNESTQYVLPFKSKPLIPYDEKLKELRFYTFDIPVEKTNIEFFKDERGNVDKMLWDRYLFHKKG